MAATLADGETVALGTSCSDGEQAAASNAMTTSRGSARVIDDVDRRQDLFELSDVRRRRGVQPVVCAADQVRECVTVALLSAQHLGRRH